MRKVYELKNKRRELLDSAEKHLTDKNMEAYNAAMEEVKALNAEIDALEALDAERGRFDEQNQQMVDLHNVQTQQKENTVNLSRLDAVRSGNEYANAWMNAMRNGASLRTIAGNETFNPLQNALTITGGAPEGSDGGFLVPIDFDGILTRKLKEFVWLADFFKVEEVTTYSGWRALETTASRTKLPKLTESQPIPKTNQPKFKKITYTIADFGDRIAISNDLLQDNIVGLMNYLAEWFAPRVVMTENDLLFVLLNSLASVALTTGKEVQGLKTALNKGLNTAHSKNAVILANQSSYDFLDQLTDTNGRGLLVPNPADTDVFRFKNRRVAMADDDLMPNREETGKEYFPLYIGDFRVYGTLFRRKALEFATTNIGGDAWANNTTEARGIVRMDAQKTDESAAIKREIAGA